MLFNSLHSIKSGDPDEIDKLAVELEFTLNTPIEKLRQAAMTLVNYKYLTTEVVDHKLRYVWVQNGERYTDVTAINMCITHHINAMYPELFFKPAAPDPNVGLFNSIELAFNPYTLRKFYENKNAIEHILDVLKTYGYTADDKCGMHIWLDYTLFGDTLEEVSNTIENFYIFLATNNKFMAKITNRPTLASSFTADLWSQLGDPFKLSPTESLAAFKLEKQKFVKNFTMNSEKQLFNIVWGKNGTNAVEFRWCAGTTEFDVMLEKMSILKNIVSFCRYSNENDLSERQLLDFSKLNIEEDNYSKGLKKLLIQSLNTFC
jgi:hypothetical protein